MKFGNHRCQWCDRVYSCECRDEHRNRSPRYDCGKCVHRAEIVNVANISRTTTAFCLGKNGKGIFPWKNR
jgi:hypothetical protein